MDEFPEFIFSQSQASTYELIERYNPAMFEAIRQRVQEGRWEVTASQWVEGDKNMSSGESISRHLLYTREYFQDKFGLSPEDVQVDFEPDTFGHPATLPTILARGGVKYYYHCRGSHGPHLYWWVGPDGSRLLALNDVDVVHVRHRARHRRSAGRVLAGHRPQIQDRCSMAWATTAAAPRGATCAASPRLNAWPIYPNVTVLDPARLFPRCRGSRRPDLPEIAGERNFVFTGCYTSQARQKWANRHGENLLYAAEAAATIGAQRGRTCPTRTTTWTRRGSTCSLTSSTTSCPARARATRATMRWAAPRRARPRRAWRARNALRALGARVDTASLREGVCRRMRSGAYKDERRVGTRPGRRRGLCHGQRRRVGLQRRADQRPGLSGLQPAALRAHRGGRGQAVGHRAGSRTSSWPRPVRGRADATARAGAGRGPLLGARVHHRRLSGRGAGPGLPRGLHLGPHGRAGPGRASGVDDPWAGMLGSWRDDPAARSTRWRTSSCARGWTRPRAAWPAWSTSAPGASGCPRAA